VSAKSKKGRGQMNIATVVSFDGSSKNALKIVMLRIDGSTVITTTLASITRDGMNFIRIHGLNEMFENSGVKEIAAMMVTGDDQQPRRE
jgi:hypothetical protein